MDNGELAMMALVIIILVLVLAVIWFVFMLPMEKGLHKRRLELVQRKLREKEARKKRELTEARDEGRRNGAGEQSRN